MGLGWGGATVTGPPDTLWLAVRMNSTYAAVFIPYCTHCHHHHWRAAVSTLPNCIGPDMYVTEAISLLPIAQAVNLPMHRPPMRYVWQ
jgi:hypothetical protein